MPVRLVHLPFEVDAPLFRSQLVKQTRRRDDGKNVSKPIESSVNGFGSDFLCCHCILDGIFVFACQEAWIVLGRYVVGESDASLRASAPVVHRGFFESVNGSIIERYGEHSL